MRPSRQFELRDRIGPGTNSRTLVQGPPEAPACEVAFLANYPAIVESLRTAPVPSLVALALDEDGIAARAVLPAQPGNAQCATVGRHDHVEVSLPGDPGLSLRHLLIVAEPMSARLKYQVIDLRTSLGMRDERGRRLDGFEADGPMLVEVGRYVLLLVPRIHAALGWSPHPLQAWQELPHLPVTNLPHPPRIILDPAGTAIELLSGVSLPVDLPPEVRDAHPIGFLELSSSSGALRRPIGRAAARGGVLLGRYDRCEAGGSPVLDQPAVSRVHALLLQVAGRMTVIDLGSINGTWVGGRRVTVRPLLAGDEVQLGRNAVRVRWIAP